MKNFLLALCVIAAAFTNAQTIYNVGPTQTYPTIAAAYSAIPATISGPYIIQLQAGYNSLAESFPIVLDARNGASATNTITIRPAVAGRAIASAHLDATIKMNGAKYIVIDGRINGQGANDLTITNSNVLGNAIEFTNGAAKNMCLYSTIVGVSDEGVIYFNGTGNASGVDSNAIRNCDLSGYSTVKARLVTMKSDANVTNDRNEVSYCNFQYFLGRNSTTNYCVTINADQNNFLFRGNSFFEPDSVYLSWQNYQNYIIYLKGSRSHGVIDSNYFGGTATHATGGPMKVAAYNEYNYTDQLVFIGFDNISSSSQGGRLTVSNNCFKNTQINANAYIIRNTPNGDRHRINAFNNVVGDESGVDSTNFVGAAFFSGYSVSGDSTNYLTNNKVTNTKIVVLKNVGLFGADVVEGNQVGSISPYGYVYLSSWYTGVYGAGQRLSNNAIYNTYANGDSMVRFFQADTVINNQVKNIITTRKITCISNIKYVKGNVFENVTARTFVGIEVTGTNPTVEGNRFYNIHFVNFKGIYIPEGGAVKAPYLNISYNVFKNINPDTVYHTGMAELPFYGIYSDRDFVKMIVVGNVIDSVTHNSTADYSQLAGTISGIHLVADNVNATIYDTSIVKCNVVSHFSFKGSNAVIQEARLFYGIMHMNTGITLDATDNEVSHITQSGSRYGAKLVGMYLDESRGAYSIRINVDRNSVHDLYTYDTLVYVSPTSLTGSRVIIGIQTTPNTNSILTFNSSVNDNKVYNLGYLGKHTRSPNFPLEVEGMHFTADDTMTHCNRNWISHLQNRSFSGSLISGITYMYGTFANNIIMLGMDKNGNDIDSSVSVFGMINRVAGNAFIRMYFNTICLSGAVTNDARSYCILDTAATVNPGNEFFIILNNLFSNSRYNAAYPNNHLCFNLPSVINTTIDLNDYYKNGNTGLGSLNMGQTVLNTLNNVKSAIIGQNSGSISANPVLVNPVSPYTNMNVAPQLTSPLIMAGFALNNVRTDHFGVYRYVLPTIGAVETPGFTSPVITAQDVPCIAGSNTGSVLVQQSPLVNWVSYKVYKTAFVGTGNISSLSYTITGLGMGEYTLVLYNANGDSLTRSILVCLSAEPTLNYSAAVQGGCGSQGVVTLTASGGTAPYTFTGFGTSNSSGIFQNLAPGNYPVTISSTEGCRVETTVTINGGGSLTAVADTVLPNSGCSQPNGYVSIIPTSGNPPFTYNLNGQINATGNFSNLQSGTYSIAVTDAVGCTVSASATVPNQIPVITISETVTANTRCANYNGAAQIQISGGGIPYSFQWSNGSITQNISSVNGGNYNITVTDNGGCTATKQVTVPNNISSVSVSVSSTTPNTSCSTPNGAATVLANGGTAPFVYNWSNSQSGATATNLTAGNITVTVTDANQCSSSVIVNVSSNLPIVSPTVNSTNETTLGANDGTAGVVVTGGQSPYTYSWSNGLLTSDSVSGLAPGQYTVTVTDVNGCSGSASFIIQSGITSATELSSESISIYPNPATSQLTINLVGLHAEQVNIYNVDGKLVSQTKQPANNTIDISNLATGVYVAEIKTKEGSAKRRWVKM